MPQTRRLLIILVLLGTVLRVPGLFTEPNVDELWSMYFAEHASSGWDIVFRLRHDNNHILNTLWLYLIGTQTELWILRLLSFLTSILLIPAIWKMLSGKSITAANAAAVLCCISFPLVYYASEARGYSPMLLCVVFAHCALIEFTTKLKYRSAIAFWCFCILGFLSHFGFLQYYLGALAYSLVIYFQNKRGEGSHSKSSHSALRHFFALQLVPLSATVFFFFNNMLGMEVSGGQAAAPERVLLNSLGLPFGGSPLIAQTGLGLLDEVLFASLTVGLWLFAYSQLRSKNHAELVFFAVTLVYAPLTLLIIQNNGVVFQRYFLVPILFTLVLMAAFSENLKQKVGLVSFTYPCLLFAIMLLNAVHLSRFYQYGRGGYSKAVVTIESRSTESVTLDPGPKESTLWLLRYVMRTQATDRITITRELQSADWRILVPTQNNSAPMTRFAPVDASYDLVEDDKYYGFSGERWLLYRASQPN